MSHMQAQIVGPTDWWEVETQQGTYWVQCEFVGYKDNVNALKLLDYLTETTNTKDILGWEFKSGYGARLSAPGYTDCTDWCFLDSEKEAREYLADQYELCPICLGDEWCTDSCGTTCLDCQGKITQDEFQAAMDSVIRDVDIMALPGVYEIVAEECNNMILQEAYDKKVVEWETQ